MGEICWDVLYMGGSVCFPIVGLGVLLPSMEWPVCCGHQTESSWQVEIIPGPSLGHLHAL